LSLQKYLAGSLAMMSWPIIVPGMLPVLINRGI
jgi:hypothetical protein